jgi:hypothetical protein
MTEDVIFIPFSASKWPVARVREVRRKIGHRAVEHMKPNKELCCNCADWTQFNVAMTKGTIFFDTPVLVVFGVISD